MSSHGNHCIAKSFVFLFLRMFPKDSTFWSHKQALQNTSIWGAVCVGYLSRTKKPTNLLPLLMTIHITFMWVTILLAPLHCNNFRSEPRYLIFILARWWLNCIPTNLCRNLKKKPPRTNKNWDGENYGDPKQLCSLDVSSVYRILCDLWKQGYCPLTNCSLGSRRGRDY